MVIIASIAPAILAIQPNRPNTMNAERTSPSTPIPETLPWARFPRKPPIISLPLPEETSERKLLIPFSFPSMFPAALETLSVIPPTDSFRSRMPSTAPWTVSLTFWVAFSPMIASLTMPTTLSSVVSFFQPT